MLLDPNSLAAYSAHLVRAYSSQDMETAADDQGELSQRLGLYRVFLKLYEHHRELLNEILDLEKISLRRNGNQTAPLNFVQGLVQGNQVHLVTNLLEETQAFYQPQQVWVIGRDRRASITLADTRLSRRHAAIQYVPQRGFCLVDLGSTNGTYVNGERVTACLWLKEGDRVRMGNIVFTFFGCTVTQPLDLLSPEVLDRVNAARLGLEAAPPVASLESPELVAAYQEGTHTERQRPLTS